MYFNLWSYLLIAFASQCIFLVAALAIKPTLNKTATRLLIVLLLVFFVINISNLFAAIHLYHTIPSITNLGRGMVLLPGPILYLYTLSILKDNFRIKTSHLLHLVPYLVALIFIWVQQSSVSNQLIIAAADSLMEGKIPMTRTATLWFVAYFLQLSVYIVLIRKEMMAVNDNHPNFIIPLEKRLEWLKRFMISFGVVAAVFLGIIIYVAGTGLYTITGNFIYTMALGGMIYLIAYQAVSNNALLKPGFATKYNSKKLNDQEELLFVKLLQLLEKDKVYLNPDLKIADLAGIAHTTPHIISRIVNEKLNKNFNELMNQYRVEEFKNRLQNPKYSHYSIMGIAYDVGYKNKTSFNEAFKKENGVTPSAYIKSLT